MQFNDSQY